MRVLITYGSKRGGTAELANMIGHGLISRGLDVEVKQPKTVTNLDNFDAVIVGGALYANRWHKDARRFVKRHFNRLAAMPVWMFSSGPLDDTATTSEIPPVGHVSKLMAGVGAQGHTTFGGRLSPDAKGFPASSMAKTNAGDWRDHDQIQSWAETIARELTTTSASSG